MLSDAYEDRFDKAYLMTADTDLVSTIKKIKLLFPNKEIVLLIPPKRREYAGELIENASKYYEIKPSHLKKFQLPNNITLQDGSIIEKPLEYK
jgi:hypothetical protein